MFHWAQKFQTCHDKVENENYEQSMEWRKVVEGAPVKVKTQLSARKVLITVFWDSKGVLLIK